MGAAARGDVRDGADCAIVPAAFEADGADCRVTLRDAEPASGQLTLDLPDESEVASALAQRALATAELADALDRDLAERGATELLAEVELPLVGVLAEMERAGIGADSEHFAAMSAELGGEVKAAEQAAFALRAPGGRGLGCRARCVSRAAPSRDGA